MTVPDKLYFEDFDATVNINSDERTITRHDLETFTKLSGDYNPLHTDEEFARNTPFGALIVQGALVLSIATGLANSMGYISGTVDAFIALDWKYRAAVKVGDTIWVNLTFKDKRSMPGYQGGLVTLNVTIYNQEHRAVQKGTWTILVRSRRE
ncbi:MAG: MaoC family dehydratase N-terminal domain-containing protein [Anaerolineae bacterium]|nr:MaoC family dehydratase N-terminal domain-containing protein [Anaerolineae bacterium]